MYRSATAPRLPDLSRVGSRTERVHNVDLAVPAPEPELIVLFDDEPEVKVAAPIVPEPEVQMVAPVAREGDKHRPIDVELLPDVPDIVKQEVEVVLALQAQAEVAAQPERKKKRKVAANMEVRRSERLRKMKN
nr:troponin T, fast skeletal muscle isoforms-like [Aegilops tauschii subsp. strangulata]